jgi:lipopolysaccharide cholinephosphotransferase
MKIKELHEHLFETLCIIDDICKKNHVRYFLDCGTELGSIREKDFIAWDDDMDLKLLLEDWPKFKKAMEKDLPPYMHLIEPTAFSPAFYDYIVRIYDERYQLRPETDEDRFYKNYQNYVGTDVCFFAKAPASKFQWNRLLFGCKIYYGLGMAHRYRIKDEKYSLIQKVQVRILRIVGQLFSVEWLWKHYLKFVSRWQEKQTGYRFPCNYPIKEMGNLLMREEWFLEDAVGMIRGREFPIPAGYDAEMTLQYGDYMKPPVDKDLYVRHLRPEDLEG